MKKVFSQEVRFKRTDGSDFPKWEEHRLGDFGVFVRGLSYGKDDMFFNPDPVVQEEIEKRKLAIGSINTKFKDAYYMWNRKQYASICRDLGLSM